MSAAGVDMAKQDDLRGAPKQKSGDAGDWRGTSMGLGVVAAIALYVALTLFFSNQLIGLMGFVMVLALWGGISYFAASRRGVAASDGNSDKRRRRSIALAWALAALMLMFYVATFVQFCSH